MAAGSNRILHEHFCISILGSDGCVCVEYEKSDSNDGVYHMTPRPQQRFEIVAFSSPLHTDLDDELPHLCLWSSFHTTSAMMSSKDPFRERDAYTDGGRRFLPVIEICHVPCRLAPLSAIGLGLHPAWLRRSRLVLVIIRS